MRKYTLITFLALFLTGCAAANCKPHVVLPTPPPVLPVNVVNGTVSGQDLDNLVENWMRVWADDILIRELVGDEE